MFAEETLLELVSPERIVYVGHDRINGGEELYPSTCFTQNIPGSLWQNCDETFLLSLRPDLIILPKEIEERIQHIFPNVAQSNISIVYLSEPKTIADIENNIVELGSIVGEVEKASKIIINMYENIEKSIGNTDGLENNAPPKVVYYREWQESFPIIADICSLDSFSGNNEYMKISDEDLSGWNPEIIFFNPAQIDTDGTIIAADNQSFINKKNLLMNNSILSNTSAICSNHVYPLVPHSSHLIHQSIKYVMDCIQNAYSVID